MRIANAFLVVWVVASACMATPSHSQNVPDRVINVRVDGFDRTYLVHLPRGKASLRKLPVVMMLHGRGATSQIAARDFGWIEKADQNGFITIFPQALPIDPARPSGSALPENYFRDWNAPTNDTFWWTHKMVANYPYMIRPESPVVHPLDTSFLTALLHDLQRRHWGDRRQVYVAGFSTGAEMASDFAQFAPNEIAAVAIVGSIGITRPVQLAHPISVFIALGKDDYLARPSATAWEAVPIAAKKRLYGQDSLPTLEQDVAAWAHLDGCRNAKTMNTPWGRQIEWSHCHENVRVRGFLVDHLGHEWPGSKPSQWNEAHPAQPSLGFTDVIWNFFRSIE